MEDLMLPIEAIREDTKRQIPQQPFRATVKAINLVGGVVQLQIGGSSVWQWYRCLENVGLDEVSIGQQAALAIFSGEPIVIGFLPIGGKQYIVPVHTHKDDAEGGDLFPITHVQASTAAGQSIPNNERTCVVFGTEVRDTLGEYNPATGIFTATVTGDYHVHALVTYAATTTWAPGEVAEVSIFVGGALHTVLQYEMDHSANNILVDVGGGTAIYLTAGQTADIRAFHNSGAPLALFASGMLNWLTIDGLR